MNWEQIRDQMRNRSAGIAGAGGLGSNCAVALVRIGIGRLVVCDFDFVEESNLNRQYYFRDQIGMPKVEALRVNLLRINPDLIINTRQVRLDSDNIPVIFNGLDLLIEAFDRADQKEMIAETALATWPDRPLIMGSGMAGCGKFESIRVRHSNNLIICGDGTSEAGPDLPPIAPRVGIVSNLMADTAAELLLAM